MKARSIRPILILVGLTLSIVSLPRTGEAQESFLLSGRVVEAGTGAPVSGALIRVDELAGREALAGSAGDWRIPGALPAGTYRVRVQRVGFAERSLSIRLPRSDSTVVIVLTRAALPLDEVVVTASRREQRLADSPVTTELISRREIEQAQVADLSTILVERLGIQLEGGHPIGEGVMLQGLGSERVLILVDGQPMLGRLSGAIDISRLPTSIIERVEVLKGPQSSLYGSEAMGGVVNVITRRAAPERWSIGMDLTGGSQGRTDFASSARGTLGSFDYLANGGRRASEITPGRAEEQGARSEKWDGLVKVGWAPRPDLEIHGNGVFLDERQRWQAGQLFHFADNQQWSGRLGADWVRGASQLSPTLYIANFNHLSRRATSSSPVAGTGEREIQRLIKGEVLYSREVGPSEIDLGLEVKREEIHSDRVRDRDMTLHSVEPYGQLSWTLGDWHIVPGARLSWSEQWGTHLTPRLATLYRPVPALALRTSIGRGYRAPSFKELYMEFLNLGAGTGYVVRGTPDLQPEVSTNLTAGVEWALGRVYLRTQLFSNHFDNFIETTLAADSSGIAVHTYGNIGDGITRGGEFEGGMTLGALRLDGGYAYLEAFESETRERLLGRPRHSARISVEYALPIGFRAVLSGIYTGAAPIQRSETGILERSSFSQLDLRFAQSLPRNLELALGARNLLDARPEAWPGFAGRHLFLGFSWQAAESNSSIQNLSIKGN